VLRVTHSLEILADELVYAGALILLFNRASSIKFELFQGRYWFKPKTR